MAKKIDTISKVRKTTPKPKETVVEKIKPQKPQIAPPELAEEHYETLFPEPTVSLKRPPTWFICLLAVILTGLLAFFGYKISNKKLDSWLSLATPTPSISSDPSLKETASPEITPTPIETPTATPTPAPTPTPTPTPTISKSAVSLRILNGTTKRGAANTARTILTNNGFTVRAIGNANHQTYRSTVIYYQSGRLQEAQLVQKSLIEYSTTLQESSLASPDMVLVVIGNQ